MAINIQNIIGGAGGGDDEGLQRLVQQVEQKKQARTASIANQTSMLGNLLKTANTGDQINELTRLTEDLHSRSRYSPETRLYTDALNSQVNAKKAAFEAYTGGVDEAGRIMEGNITGINGETFSFNDFMKNPSLASNLTPLQIAEQQQRILMVQDSLDLGTASGFVYNKKDKNGNILYNDSNVKSGFKQAAGVMQGAVIAMRTDGIIDEHEANMILMGDLDGMKEYQTRDIARRKEEVGEYDSEMKRITKTLNDLDEWEVKQGVSGLTMSDLPPGFYETMPGVMEAAEAESGAVPGSAEFNAVSLDSIKAKLNENYKAIQGDKLNATKAYTRKTSIPWKAPPSDDEKEQVLADKELTYKEPGTQGIPTPSPTDEELEIAEEGARTKAAEIEDERDKGDKTIEDLIVTTPGVEFGDLGKTDFLGRPVTEKVREDMTLDEYWSIKNKSIEEGDDTILSDELRKLSKDQLRKVHTQLMAQKTEAKDVVPGITTAPSGVTSDMQKEYEEADKHGYNVDSFREYVEEARTQTGIPLFIDINEPIVEGLDIIGKYPPGDGELSHQMKKREAKRLEDNFINEQVASLKKQYPNSTEESLRAMANKNLKDTRAKYYETAFGFGEDKEAPLATLAKLEEEQDQKLSDMRSPVGEGLLDAYEIRKRGIETAPLSEVGKKKAQQELYGFTAGVTTQGLDMNMGELRILQRIINPSQSFQLGTYINSMPGTEKGIYGGGTAGAQAFYKSLQSEYIGWVADNYPMMEGKFPDKPFEQLFADFMVDHYNGLKGREAGAFLGEMNRWKPYLSKEYTGFAKKYGVEPHREQFVKRKTNEYNSQIRNLEKRIKEQEAKGVYIPEIGNFKISEYTGKDKKPFSSVANKILALENKDKDASAIYENKSGKLKGTSDYGLFQVNEAWVVDPDLPPPFGVQVQRSDTGEIITDVKHSWKYNKDSTTSKAWSDIQKVIERKHGPNLSNTQRKEALLDRATNVEVAKIIYDNFGITHWSPFMKASKTINTMKTSLDEVKNNLKKLKSS